MGWLCGIRVNEKAQKVPVPSVPAPWLVAAFLVGIWAIAQISVAREAHFPRGHFIEDSKADGQRQSHEHVPASGQQLLPGIVRCTLTASGKAGGEI